MSKPIIKYAALLDGGLGQEIYRRACNVSSPLWSVAVMLEEPEIVTAVHEEFIRAGAKTLTLNTYSATPSRLKAAGLDHQIEEIHQKAFLALEQAIEARATPVDIAGCLGPLEGSYRMQPTRSFAELYAEFSELVRLQAKADVILIETMTNTLEATAAAAAAKELGKPFAVAFRLEMNGKLKSGESLSEAVFAVKDYSPTAILLNCCDPDQLTLAMPELVKLYPCVGGYANAFKSIDAVARGNLVDALEARSEMSPSVYSNQVNQWLAAGAGVVGGCCEITPTHIKHLANDLMAQQYTLIPFSELASKSVSHSTQGR